MKSIYNEKYYKLRYTNTIFNKIGLAGLYYIWTAFFCLILPAKLKPGDCVFEVGCGIGNLVRSLRFFGIHAYGYDPSKAASKYCVSPEYCIYGYNFTNAYKKLLNKPVKLIYSNEVCEHLNDKSLNSIFNNSYAKTAQYHIHMICTKERQKDISFDKTHINVQSVSWWYTYFQNLGYKVSHGNFFYFFPSIFEKGLNLKGIKSGYFLLNRYHNNVEYI